MVLMKIFLDCYQADSRVFWHDEISVDKTHQLYCRVEPECSREPEPEDEV